MKITAVTPCYNDEATFFGSPERPDASEQIANDLGATVIKGSWPLDHHQRNLGIKMSQDANWVLTLDSDELFTVDGMTDLMDYLATTDAVAIGCRPECYWFDTDHVLRPKSGFEPIIAVKPHVKFKHIRNIDYGYTLWDGTMHHLSWCQPKDILKKVTNYAHADELKDAAGWYRDKFLHWKDGNNALMPDGSMYNVARQPLPKELYALLG